MSCIREGSSGQNTSVKMARFTTIGIKPLPACFFIKEDRHSYPADAFFRTS